MSLATEALVAARAVIFMRRLLLASARALVQDGKEPIGLEDLPYDRIVSEAYTAPLDVHWTDKSPLDEKLALPVQTAVT